MKRMKNNLDERQERQLLRIEGRGYWIAYWTLLISIFVQQGLFGVAEWKSVAGEWIVFMILCIYLVSGCLKNGIWDRHLKADSRTNLYVSAAAGVVFAVISGVISYLNYNNWPGRWQRRCLPEDWQRSAAWRRFRPQQQFTKNVCVSWKKMKNKFMKKFRRLDRKSASGTFLS